jgi:hypothetical protein
MKSGFRFGHACAALCMTGAAAAAPDWQAMLPRERVSLAGLEAAPLTRAELTLAGADGTEHAPNFLALPVRGDGGAQVLLAGGAADGLRWAAGGIVLARREGRFDLDGTAVSLPLGPGRLYASVERRHWGPSPFGSLILDGASRALPAAGWRKTAPEPFASPWFAWLGPWRADLFAGRLSNDIGPGDVKLLGARLEVEPVPGLRLGASRVLQWGGEGRPQTLGSLLRALAGLDNFEDGSDRSVEPGNQLAGVDARWTLPLDSRHRVSVHGQAIGEDEAGHWPSRYLASAGGEIATVLAGGASLRLFGEWADTMAGRAFGRAYPGAAYRHPLYPAGYAQRNEPLGHPAGPDVRLASAGMAWRRGPASLLLMAHRGSAPRRGIDAELRLALPEGLALGLAATQWRGPLGRERGLQLRIELPLDRVRATPAVRSASSAGSS